MLNKWKVVLYSHALEQFDRRRHPELPHGLDGRTTTTTPAPQNGTARTERDLRVRRVRGHTKLMRAAQPTAGVLVNVLQALGDTGTLKAVSLAKRTDSPRLGFNKRLAGELAVDALSVFVGIASGWYNLVAA